MFEGWESCLRTERGEWQLKLPSKCSAWAVSSRWSQTPHVPVSTTAGRLLGFTQNVLYSGNTEHISARAGCLHPVVSCYKSAAKPIQLCCTHSTAPQSSAAQAAAFHELLKFPFLFVAKHQSSTLKKNFPLNFSVHWLLCTECRWELLVWVSLQKYFPTQWAIFHSWITYEKSTKITEICHFFPIRIILIIFY